MAGLFGGGRDKGAENRQKQQDYMRQLEANKQEQQRQADALAQQQRFDEERRRLEEEKRKAYEDSKKSTGSFLGAPTNSYSLSADATPRNTFLGM